MERSDWSDEEPFAFRPPLPPEDRVWRHPSELGEDGRAGGRLRRPLRAARCAGIPARTRVALAVAVGATGALLIVVLATVGLLHRRRRGAPPTVQPSASTFSFAPTTDRRPTAWAAPAEGAVHLVATTVDGTQVASGVVLDARGTIATTAAAVLGATGVVAYLADGTEYEATHPRRRHRIRRRRRAGRRPAARGVERLGRHPVGRRHRAHRRRRPHRHRSTPSASTPRPPSAQALTHLVRLDVDDDAPTSPRAPPSLDQHERVVGLATHARDDRIYAVPIEIPRAAARSINVHGRVRRAVAGRERQRRWRHHRRQRADGRRRLAGQLRRAPGRRRHRLDGRPAHRLDGRAGAVAARLRRRRRWSRTSPPGHASPPVDGRALAVDDRRAGRWRTSTRGPRTRPGRRSLEVAPRRADRRRRDPSSPPRAITD